MIEFNCPKCGAHFEVEDGMAGKEVMCTECTSVSRVLSPVPHEAGPKRPASPTSHSQPAGAASRSGPAAESPAPSDSPSLPYASPRAAQPPRYILLRLVASLHFIFGAVCLVAGGFRLTMLVYQRWVLDMAFYIRGSTILRTFVVAAVGLFLMGIGTLLHCLRDLVRNRFYQRP